MIEGRRGLEPHALKIEEEAASQEIQVDVQKAKRRFSLRASRRNQPRRHLEPRETDFGLLACRSVREYICVVLSH